MTSLTTPECASHQHPQPSSTGLFCLLETWRSPGMCQDSPLTSEPWDTSNLGQSLPTWKARKDAGRWEPLSDPPHSKFWQVKMKSLYSSQGFTLLSGTYSVYSNFCAKCGGCNCTSDIEVKWIYENFVPALSSVFSCYITWVYMTDRWENIRKQGDNIGYRAFLVRTALSLGKYLYTLITSPLNLSFYHKLESLNCSWVRTFFQAFKIFFWLFSSPLLNSED